MQFDPVLRLLISKIRHNFDPVSLVNCQCSQWVNCWIAILHSIICYGSTHLFSANGRHHCMNECMRRIATGIARTASGFWMTSQGLRIDAHVVDSQDCPSLVVLAGFSARLSERGCMCLVEGVRNVNARRNCRYTNRLRCECGTRRISSSWFEEF